MCKHAYLKEAAPAALTTTIPALYTIVVGVGGAMGKRGRPAPSDDRVATPWRLVSGAGRYTPNPCFLPCCQNPSYVEPSAHVNTPKPSSSPSRNSPSYRSPAQPSTCSMHGGTPSCRQLLSKPTPRSFHLATRRPDSAESRIRITSVYDILFISIDKACTSAVFESAIRTHHHILWVHSLQQHSRRM